MGSESVAKPIYANFLAGGQWPGGPSPRAGTLLGSAGCLEVGGGEASSGHLLRGSGGERESRPPGRGREVGRTGGGGGDEEGEAPQEGLRDGREAPREEQRAWRRGRGAGG